MDKNTLENIRIPLVAQPQEAINWEIFVCDNNDYTVSITASMGGKIAFEPVRHISRVRNTGIPWQKAIGSFWSMLTPIPVPGRISRKSASRLLGCWHKKRRRQGTHKFSVRSHKTCIPVKFMGFFSLHIGSHFELNDLF